MPEPENKAPDADVEVVAHSADDDEELNAGCTFNGSIV